MIMHANKKSLDRKRSERSRSSRSTRSKRKANRIPKRVAFWQIDNAARRDPRNQDALNYFWSLTNALNPMLLQSMECVRCDASVVFEQFMLHDELWTQTGLGEWDGMLCVGCVEAAIGRKLTKADFVKHRFHGNDFPKSTRLRKRLER
jgi:hypothetical protein